MTSRTQSKPDIRRRQRTTLRAAAADKIKARLADPNTRVAAALSLRDRRDAQAVPALLAHAQDPDPVVREAVIRALRGARWDAQLAAEVMEVCAIHYRLDKDSGVRRATLATMTDLKRPYLRARDARTVNAILKRLRQGIVRAHSMTPAEDSCFAASDAVVINENRRRDYHNVPAPRFTQSARTSSTH